MQYVNNQLKNLLLIHFRFFVLGFNHKRFTFCPRQCDVNQLSLSLSIQRNTQIRSWRNDNHPIKFQTLGTVHGRKMNSFAIG